MWTAGLIECGLKGRIRVGTGLSLVLQQFFGTAAVHKTVAGLACRLWSKHFFFSYSFRAVFVADLIMLFSSVGQCLVKWYNPIQTKLPVTSGHSGGWVAKACSLNSFLPLSSNILILWPNPYKPPHNANAFRINGNLYVLRQECVLFQELGLPEFKNWAKYFKHGLISNMLYSYMIPAFWMSFVMASSIGYINTLKVHINIGIIFKTNCQDKAIKEPPAGEDFVVHKITEMACFLSLEYL